MRSQIEASRTDLVRYYTTMQAYTLLRYCLYYTDLKHTIWVSKRTKTQNATTSDRVSQRTRAFFVSRAVALEGAVVCTGAGLADGAFEDAFEDEAERAVGALIDRVIEGPTERAGFTATEGVLEGGGGDTPCVSSSDSSSSSSKAARTSSNQDPPSSPS